MVALGDRIIPALVPGRTLRRASADAPSASGRIPSTTGTDTPAAEPLAPRELDLRRTPAPAPGELPPIRLRHLRRYSTSVFDHKGRLTCGMLFDVLGWEAGTRIDITAHAGTIVVRGARGGAHEVKSRRFLHIPATVRHWCSFGARELVLLRAVPELSVLLIFGQERLDQALPDPRRLVDAARAVGGQVGGSGGGPSDRAVEAGRSVSRPAAGSGELGGGRRG